MFRSAWRWLLVIALAGVGCSSGSGPPPPAPGAAPITGRRRHLPQSHLLEVVRRLRQGDRRADQLSVHRLRRRHPPVHRGHGGLRRDRRADDRRADRRRQRRRAPHPDGARRGGRRPTTCPALGKQPLRFDGADAGRHLPRQDHQVERPADRGAQPGRRPCRTRTSSWCTAPTAPAPLHLHRLPVQGVARVEGQGRAAPPRSSGRSASAARATRA